MLPYLWNRPPGTQSPASLSRQQAHRRGPPENPGRRNNQLLSRTPPLLAVSLAVGSAQAAGPTTPVRHPLSISIHPMTFSPSPKHCGTLPRLPVCCRAWSHSTAISWRAIHDESQLSRQPFSLHPAPLYLHLHLPRNTRHERHQQSSHARSILPHAPQRVPPSPARIRSISPISAADDDVRSSPPEYGPS